jgi:hypothetical protein
LSKEQANLVKKAEKGLTAEEQARIRRRTEKLDQMVMPEAGPSKNKGKAKDLTQSWEDVDKFHPSELDVDNQRAEFARINTVQDLLNSDDDSMDPEVQRALFEEAKRATHKKERRSQHESRNNSDTPMPEVSSNVNETSSDAAKQRNKSKKDKKSKNKSKAKGSDDNDIDFEKLKADARKKRAKKLRTELAAIEEFDRRRAKEKKASSKKGKDNDPNSSAPKRSADQDSKSKKKPERVSKHKKLSEATSVIDETIKNTRKLHKAGKSTSTSKIRPSSQVAEDSYIGKALRPASRMRGGAPSTSADDPDSSSSGSSSDSSESSVTSSDASSSSSSPSSSSSSSPESSSSSSSASTFSDSTHRQRRRRRAGEKLKPVPPEKYSGAADTRLFYRFVQEATDYVEAGNVSRQRQVFVISRFLTGKAWDYYTQSVSLDPFGWRLRDFFIELFNFCFPRDFRSEQREKLARCFQNERTVKEYVHNLIELYNMIGEETDRNKVVKLWRGFRKEIKAGLFRADLHPEVSSWDQVVDKAETIEVAEQEGNPRDRRQLADPQRRGNKSNRRNTSPTTERHKYNNIPRNRRDYSPEPRKKSVNQETREFFGKGKFKRRNGNGNNYICSNQSQAKASTPKPEKQQLSEKEKEEHRAEGRCFNQIGAQMLRYHPTVLSL